MATVARKTYKAIAYAYPTSPTAVALGYGDSGCYLVQQTLLCVNNHPDDCRTVDGTRGYKAVDDPQLIADFIAADGVVSPAGLRYSPERYSFL